MSWRRRDHRRLRQHHHLRDHPRRGVAASYNSAQFLGHLPGKRGARGPVRIGPGTLLVIDEASMMTGPNLADLITLAEAQGGKVIVAGDTEQLQAVQNGGGMSLLADRLGYVRLAQPVRFQADWEKDATGRLPTASGEETPASSGTSRDSLNSLPRKGSSASTANPGEEMRYRAGKRKHHWFFSRVADLGSSRNLMIESAPPCRLSVTHV